MATHVALCVPQVGAAATAAQARNIALCSQLQEVHRSLGGFTGRLPAAAAQALGAALDTLQVCACACTSGTWGTRVRC